MRRRHLPVALAASGFGFALAQGGPVEGQQYQRVSPPAPTSVAAGKTVEVIEFFWYECQHCHDFDPLVQAWSRTLPPEVWFHRVPVGFTARHQVTQKLYYALENLGQAEALHARIFDAIHVQKKPLLGESEMLAFVKALGVDGTKFAEMFRSFQVHSQAVRAQQLAQAYKIDGVPSMGVAGRFFTSGTLAGSNERSLAVVSFLLERLRKPV